MSRMCSKRPSMFDIIVHHVGWLGQVVEVVVGVIREEELVSRGTYNHLRHRQTFPVS